MAWAKAHGYCENELATKAVREGLPPQPKAVKHMASMPFADVPAFVARLEKSSDTIARLALRFTILTASRSGEVRGARWEEIDLKAATWTIPAERMKMDREHIVPLSKPALAILSKLGEVSRAGLVFPGTKRGREMSDMTVLKALRDMGEPFTVHGFRSSFRDWAAERTDFPNHVAEMALAHAVKGVEGAYRRGGLLDKRRPLMEAWGRYVSGPGIANVINIGEAA